MTSSRRDRFLSGAKIAGFVRNATGTRISAKTVRRRLRCARLRSRRPYVGVPLTVGHKHARLNWATAHRRWTRRQWNEVVFTDESRFNLKPVECVFGGDEANAWIQLTSSSVIVMEVAA